MQQRRFSVIFSSDKIITGTCIREYTFVCCDLVAASCPLVCQSRLIVASQCFFFAC